MKRIIQAGLIMFSVILSAASASADSKASVERGRSLFESSSLGTTGKSCSSCHSGGSGLEDSSSSADKELEQTTNNCIQKALKGKPLAVGSQELSSIILYMKSLGKNRPK